MLRLLNKRKKAENPLINDLQSTRLELETAYSVFENAVDPDLVSSSIYRINSVQNSFNRKSTPHPVSNNLHIILRIFVCTHSFSDYIVLLTQSF